MGILHKISIRIRIQVTLQGQTRPVGLSFDIVSNVLQAVGLLGVRSKSRVKFDKKLALISLNYWRLYKLQINPCS
jgi:hypothetical protein